MAKPVVITNPEEFFVDLRETDRIELHHLRWKPDVSVWFEAEPQEGTGNYERVEVQLAFCGSNPDSVEIAFSESIHASELTENVTIAVRDMIGRTQWSAAVGATLAYSLKGKVDFLYEGGNFIEIYAQFGTITIGVAVPRETLASFFEFT